MNYVIIGNSTAAIGCIEGIRQVDPQGPITVITNEKYHTYSRPLISYLLYGKTDEERMKYRPDNFYQKNHCQLLTGKTVEQIRCKEREVVLSDGQTLPYDKLLVATGSSPVIPPIEGLGSVSRKYTFMSLDDAKELEQNLLPESRVLIMGAGLIGLKCAEGIAHRVGHITVVDMAERILPNILDEASAGLVQEHLEQQGIEFILGSSVVKYAENQAELQNGQKIFFDILVVAVGVKPNTKLISAAGGNVRRGIVTDMSCETSLTDIYAAGDCAESMDITTGEHRILALLPNAYMQGECAGLNMAGGYKNYNQAMPMNSTGLFGLHIITAGNYEGQAYVVQGDKTYKKLITKDGLLKGYILIGEVARAGIYTSLIKEQKPLEKIDFNLIKDKPQLMAFSKRDRQKMLGGAAG